jgi:2-dehydropantoate 2-reductase
MKYLVIGAGGTGGLIGGYLARAHQDVTLVARGKHLEAIQQKGLTIKTYGCNPITVKNIVALPESDLNDQKFDIIFVTVKAYSLKDVIKMVLDASHSKTLIIPILNSLGAGSYLRKYLPGLQVYDGCIYITGYVSAPGEVSQNNPIFRIVYGLNEKSSKNKPERERMQNHLRQSGIDVLYSEEITGEIFKKLTFTSAFAAAAAYYDKQAGDLQIPGEARELFVKLLDELCEIASGAQIACDRQSVLSDNITILDSLS